MYSWFVTANSCMANNGTQGGDQAGCQSSLKSHTASRWDLMWCLLTCGWEASCPNKSVFTDQAAMYVDTGSGDADVNKCRYYSERRWLGVAHITLWPIMMTPQL